MLTVSYRVISALLLIFTRSVSIGLYAATATKLVDGILEPPGLAPDDPAAGEASA